MGKQGEEFREIGHCGGQFTIRVVTDTEGNRGVHFGVRHSRPTAAGWFAIYALRQGVPVGMIQIRGIGVPWNPAPLPDCIPVFIASDTEAKFGHRCPHCRGYWRSDAVPSTWDMSCPYCGSRMPTHDFLTDGQRKYVVEFCRLTDEALRSPDGEYSLDMDEVADAVGRDTPKPKLYYADESQQNKFLCEACRAFNDILGRYGYCSSCGTHNGLIELEKDIELVRTRAHAGGSLEAAAKDAVSAFDSCARQVAKQLAHRIPMTPRRKKEWKRRLFHSLTDSAKALGETFDIDVAKGISTDDLAFATLMFHRRHVYEHNGGEADEKYIADSGDKTVRPKQLLRESRESVERLCVVVAHLGRNLIDGLHAIFPPEERPLAARARRTPAKVVHAR
jgi:Zn finger protein HypA/HybF involved in hydrogenase expression